MSETKKYIDQYEVGGILGNGANATIYQATHIEHDNEVALKLYNTLTKAEKVTIKARFLATKDLSQDNIWVPIDGDFSNHKSVAYLTMLIGEGSLDKLMLNRYQDWFVEAEIVKMMTDIAEGLTYLHFGGVNIAHLDVKPSNILFYTNKKGIRTYALTDFDNSIDLNGTSKRNNMEDLNLGFTPEYAAPEQLKKGYTGQRASDVFALGITLFELMT